MNQPGRRLHAKDAHALVHLIARLVIRFRAETANE